jgi:YegS/Rv2252/BmrU family lipid kinase
MNIVVVYNPSSGASDSFKEIQAAFADLKVAPEYIPITTNRLHDKLRTAASKKGTTIVAAGGDGTINGVVHAVIGTKCKLGIIPVGTLNHFARELNVPLDIPGAVQTILKGKTVRVDAAAVNDRSFVNNSSIGWYPRSLRTRDELGDRIGKWPAALVGSVKAMIRPRRYHVELTIDGQKHTYRTPFVFVGNNAYKRGEPGVGQRETLHGGQVAIYVVKAQSITGIVRMLFHGLLTRKHRTQDFAIYYTSECTIQTRHHRRLNVACDGEVTSLRTPLHYKSVPEALDVITP